MSEPNKLDSTPGLPDDTPISDVELPARIRNVLVAAGLETVGEVRETADETQLSFQDLGKSLSPIFARPWGYRRPTVSGRRAKSPRRRDLESREESWLVYYGDVDVGECTNGSAATFDQARADFEQAWAVFLSNRTEADFQECPDARAIGPRENMRCGMLASDLSRPAMDWGSLRTDSENAHAARYSTCTAPRKYSCTCLTSLRPKRY